jgi:hypothetical protein
MDGGLLHCRSEAGVSRLANSTPPRRLYEGDGFVKGVWGVSLNLVAVCRAWRVGSSAFAGSGGRAPALVALDAAGRVWQQVRVRGRVVGGEQRSSLYRLIGSEDQVSWEVAAVAHFQREPSSG